MIPMNLKNPSSVYVDLGSRYQNSCELYLTTFFSSNKFYNPLAAVIRLGLCRLIGCLIATYSIHEAKGLSAKSGTGIEQSLGPSGQKKINGNLIAIIPRQNDYPG